MDGASWKAPVPGCWAAAVAAALKGETGKMMAFKRISNNPYKVEIEPVDANLVANNEFGFFIVGVISLIAAIAAAIFFAKKGMF